MVKGKEGIAKKKDFLILFGALIIIGFIVFVLAAWEPSLVSPVAIGNYSTSLKFICNTSIENPVNASLMYNATGGPTTLILMTVYNTSANQSGFQNDSVNLLGLSDGANYNFTCLISNQTGTNAYSTLTNVSMVTIDNTPPNVTYYGIANGDYVNGTITLSASVIDTISGVRAVYYNITDSTGARLNWTNASTDGSGYYNTSINTTDFANGVYNITIIANDSYLTTLKVANGTLFSNLNNSETISITIDNTAPTATHTCTPNTTVGMVVTCTCSGSDATAGVNYTYDGTTASGNTGIVEKITTTAAGTFSRTCTVRDRAGNSASAIASYAISNPVSGTTGGTTTTSPTTSIVTAATITPTSPVTISNFASGSGVTEIQIEVSETATNVQVTVQNYETTAPSAVSSSLTTAYKYLKVDAQNLANKLSKATMKIQVEKTWVSGQGTVKEDVALFKYDTTASQWNELTTTYASEDDNYYYYTVELSSFSYFVIATKGAVISEGEAPTGEEEQLPTAAGLPIWAWVAIGLVVLVIIIGGGVALGKKKKK
ncbi:hypothetical protein A3K82_01085 [Candidatus Pacearchaeota archaeon RBG_19FT_COMBO_34_9]|nr:MAG: hypothetical protein A3K82_01085 [Candidatus Pacearchaeota archaeon RBG_19FT_COMBO_34_9]OGJ16516.1 MAG: hypothetical protein A3K74_00185 [Candidatus Pacearchaeota archaeon RBG_13_33_26]